MNDVFYLQRFNAHGQGSGDIIFTITLKTQVSREMFESLLGEVLSMEKQQVIVEINPVQMVIPGTGEII